MSENVSKYLELCRSDERQRRALKDLHHPGRGDAQGEGARRRVVAPIVAHARKLGFEFSEDELIRYITGGG